MNETPYTSEDDYLKSVLYAYLSYWKWFAASLVVCILAGIYIYLSSEHRYEVSASVLLKENRGSSSHAGVAGSLEELGLLSTTTNIDNEMAVITSPNLLRDVVRALDLHTRYYEKGIFRNREIYRQCPYIVRWEQADSAHSPGGVVFTLKQSDGRISVHGQYLRESGSFSFQETWSSLPGTIQLPDHAGRLVLSLRHPAVTPTSGSYLIQIGSVRKATAELVERLTVVTAGKNSSVLNLTVTTANTAQGADILWEIVSRFNDYHVRENNEMAINTARFIDERLIEIAGELSAIEKRIVDYKKEQQLADLSTEARIFVEQTSQIEQKRIDVETQLKTIELVEAFAQNSANEFKLIPNLGITDPGLTEVIARFNSALLGYERLDASTGQENTVRKRTLAELTNTRGSILEAVNNVKRSLNIYRKELEKQASQLSSRIHDVPDQERGLLEITRQQQIKQELYLYLLQVKEETNISLAATSEKARVITDPVIPNSPASPRKSIIGLAAIVLGLFLPLVIIYTLRLFQVTIRNKEELEYLSQPVVIGEIGRNTGEDFLIAGANCSTPILELFRALRNNLRFILNTPDKQVILITSTLPNEGKTFIAANLAATFSLTDQKVLLIGADIRNPGLAEQLHFPLGEGLTAYLSGETDKWQSLVQSPAGAPRLHVLQGGVVPPNPNELLMSPRFKQLIREARECYDIILLDSAPVGAVSDTFLLGGLADTTLYITRERVTPKKTVKLINEIHAGHKLPSVYVLLNDTRINRQRNYYGYYGYISDRRH